MTGTARVVGQGVGRRRPLTGATAAKSFESSQASWLVIRAPPENPVAYTFLGFTQYFDSMMPTSDVRNFTSLAAFFGTAPPPMSGTPGMFQSKPTPSGMSAWG